MSITRGTRRLAFQALFQIDAHHAAGGKKNTDKDVRLIRESLVEEHPGLSAVELDSAMELALGAWADRAAADKATVELAPTWPAHRQAAVDRAILRLAHFDMTKGPGSDKPKIVVNDAVELAKEFSTDKSPGFVNALLDKVLKRVLGVSSASAEAEPAAIEEPDPS
ncbi:MAG: transcription antitermination factor NusB [Phycisphaerales bacterium]|nr:transcription antitermination factor NusB [Phycisphaerales bacterium]